MKALLVYNSYESNRNREFINMFFDEGNKLGIEFKLIIVENLKYGIFENQLKFIYDYDELTDIDFVIMRDKNYELSRAFENKGIRVFNNSNLSLIANNKFSSYLYAKSKNIPVLDTKLLVSDNQVNDFPKIIKSLDGKGGKEVYLCDNIEELLDAKLTINKDKLIVQEVAKDIGKDLRVYCIGKEIICAMLRIAKEGFKSNFCLGNDCVVYDLDDQEKELVHNIIDDLDSDFVGVDFLFNDGDLVFNEIEDVVGCRMVYEKTDINMVKLYLEYIIKQIKNIDTTNNSNNIISDNNTNDNKNKLNVIKKDYTMEKITDMTIKDYINILSSKTSMPGGGTTSALTAAMGVSLYLMVINLSVDKDKYKDNRNDLIKYREELDRFKNELLSLIDADVEAYESMISVYNMKAETDIEKAEKEAKKQEALSTCAEPPMKVMQLSLACMDYALKLIGNTTKSAESDLIVGTINLKSAINSSYQNVLINAKYMKDEEQADGLKSLAKAMVEKSKVITHMINDEIKK